MPRDLTLTTYRGIPGGMNLAVPAHMIPDIQARYLQDVLVDKPGFLRRRGPAQNHFLVNGYRPIGLGQTVNPSGRVICVVPLVIIGGGTSVLGFIDADFVTAAGFETVNGISFSEAPYTLFDIKPMHRGGTLLGMSSAYEGSAVGQSLQLWKGSSKPTTTTGTLSLTRGSATVTGVGTSWLSTVDPGMFVLVASTTEGGAHQFWAGQVKSVQTNTSLTMETISPVGASGVTFAISPVRPFVPKVATGYITTSTSSTTVTGSNTKFKDQQLNTGTWALYRQSDNVYIGTVSVVNSNTSITLAANAAVTMNVEHYVAQKLTDSFNWSMVDNARGVGFINSIYAGRQWYANQAKDADDTGDYFSRLWFSDPEDPEFVDLSTTDGNFIPINSTKGVNSPIKALAPTTSALVVAKDEETFGVFGTTSATFTVRKILDDGVLSGMSMTLYNKGVIWAGRNGIYYYDGINVDTISDNLGEYYRNAVRSFDATAYRMYGTTYRDHYFLHIERVQPSESVVKGSTATTPNQYTIVIHIPTKATSIFTNMYYRGATVLPGSTGKAGIYVINTTEGGAVVDFDSLFDAAGVADESKCLGAETGPDFYVSTKKYTGGNDTQQKLWKMFILSYSVLGGSLYIDPVIGLEEGSATPQTIVESTFTWDSLRAQNPSWNALSERYATWNSITGLGVFKLVRKKFTKRSPFISFRIYERDAAAGLVNFARVNEAEIAGPSTVTEATLGSWTVGFKPARPGRI